jgi:DNA-binding GntR family transcriptional regulator
MCVAACLTRPLQRLGEIMEQDFNYVVSELAQAAAPGIPKHVRLRNALLSAIRKGYLKPGDQLPPEQELSKVIGLSLGTVQRALGSLANERTLTREQGRGTFISKSDLSPDDLWQFRFVDKFGAAPLPVSVVLLDRRLLRERRPELDVLGYDERGYCELKRLVIVNENFRCLSRVYVRISRFPKIMKMEISRIRGNLKTLLAEEFNAPTRSLDQFILTCILADEVCSALKIKRGSAGMVVNTIGQSIGQEAITVQSLLVPAAQYFLEVSATPRTPNAVRPAFEG